MRRMLRSSAPSRSAVQPSAAVGDPARRARSCSRDDRLGELARERVDLALVERRQRLPGDVPLVEQDERRAARRPPAGHQPISAIVDVDALDLEAGDAAPSASPTRSCTARASSASGCAVRARRARARPTRGRPRAATSTARRGLRTRTPLDAARRTRDELGERGRRHRDRPLRPARRRAARSRAHDRRQPRGRLGEVAGRVARRSRTPRCAGCRAPARASSARPRAELAERPQHRAIAAGRVSSQTTSLREQRVVVRRDAVAVLDVRVDADARAERRPEARRRCRAPARSRCAGPRR